MILWHREEVMSHHAFCVFHHISAICFGCQVHCRPFLIVFGPLFSRRQLKSRRGYHHRTPHRTSIHKSLESSVASRCLHRRCIMFSLAQRVKVIQNIVCFVIFCFLSWGGDATRCRDGQELPHADHPDPKQGRIQRTAGNLLFLLTSVL